MVIKQNWEVTQGADEPFTAQFIQSYDINNVPVYKDISSWSFYLTVRKNYDITDLTDAKAIIKKNPSDFTKTEGTVSINFNISNDGGLIPAGNYFYDIYIIDDEDKRYPLLSGNFIVRPQATNRTP